MNIKSALIEVLIKQEQNQAIRFFHGRTALTSALIEGVRPVLVLLDAEERLDEIERRSKKLIAETFVKEYMGE